MFITSSVKPYRGTGGAHIIASQVASDNPAARRVVILNSADFSVVQEFAHTDREGLNNKLIELAGGEVDAPAAPAPAEVPPA